MHSQGVIRSRPSTAETTYIDVTIVVWQSCCTVTRLISSSRSNKQCKCYLLTAVQSITSYQTKLHWCNMWNGLRIKRCTSGHIHVLLCSRYHVQQNGIGRCLMMDGSQGGQHMHYQRLPNHVENWATVAARKHVGVAAGATEQVLSALSFGSVEAIASKSNSYNTKQLLTCPVFPSATA